MRDPEVCTGHGECDEGVDGDRRCTCTNDAELRG
eukprot:gene47529-37526_t